MIKMDLLDALSDSELDQIEAYSQALKKRRDEERKAKALREVEAILAAAGISLQDIGGKPKGRQAKGAKRRKKSNEAA